jgi:hypothetical protein
MAKAVSYAPLLHLEAAPSAWMQLEAQRRILRALHCSPCATRRQWSERVHAPIVSRRRLSPRRDCHRSGIRRPLVGNLCIAGAASASRLRSIPLPPRQLSGLSLRIARVLFWTISRYEPSAAPASERGGRQDLALRVSRLLALCRMSSRCSKHGSGRDDRRALRAVVPDGPRNASRPSCATSQSEVCRHGARQSEEPVAQIREQRRRSR